MAPEKGSVQFQSPLHRLTRSGRSFATWDGPHVTVPNPDFQFDVRLQDAIALERARCYGEVFGYDSNAFTPLSSPDQSPIVFAQPIPESESIPTLTLSRQSYDQFGNHNDDSPTHLSSPDGLPRTIARPTAEQDGDGAPTLDLNDQDSDCTATLIPAQPSTSSISTPLAGLSAEPEDSKQEQRHKRKRKISHKQRKEKRAKLKAETYGGGHTAQPNAQAKYIQPALPIEVSAPWQKARAASTGYVGLDDGERSKKVYSKEELVRKGFKAVEWDGVTPTPIVANNQLIGLLAGRPKFDMSWDDMMTQAANGLEEARQQCHIPPKEKTHRRGPFSVLRSGVSHGGGQRRPGNLRSNSINSAVLDKLSAIDAFRRLAGFASSVMRHWAPQLYEYYVEKLGDLFKHYPDLERNFTTSLFTANTYNLGPQTVCYKHADFYNLPFGLCAITALGRFNPKKGGHLVMWECKLIIEFPPGSTILMLSAIVAHLNLPVNAGETRYLFTQFSSGGLFRWVDNGYQKSTAFWASLSPEAREEEEKKEAN